MTRDNDDRNTMTAEQQPKTSKPAIAAMKFSLRRRLTGVLRRILRRRRRSPGSSHLHYSELKGRDASEWQAALRESPETAARWIYAAASYGDPDAQIHWAQMLLDGHGVARDIDSAFRWFEIAARSEQPDAVNMLGRCHERGWGTPIDLVKAAACYRRAADKNHAWAQFNLANLLLAGDGIPRQPETAFHLLSRAVAQGHTKSLHVIGLCCEFGWGCSPDSVAARDWQRRAAESGDVRGQYRYGQLLYEAGQVADSLAWLTEAVVTGPEAFCRTVAHDLLQHPDPQISALGERARQRIEARAASAAAPA